MEVLKNADIKDALLDRPYKVQIVLSQYINTEDPEHDMGWECDIFYKGVSIGGGTSPTEAGAYDLANEIIFDYENPSLF